jgi:hypothetical protein
MAGNSRRSSASKGAVQRRDVLAVHRWRSLALDRDTNSFGREMSVSMLHTGGDTRPVISSAAVGTAGVVQM